jgi:CDP-diacylglycerol--glycerol-3-phosphate 3-phosphatidyltransferase
LLTEMTKMNFINWLTTSRVLLLPIAILPITLGWREGWLITAAVTSLAGLSDFVDGYLARKMKLTTPLGANLDYLSDKIFVGGMLISLASFGLIATWIPIVVLVRELAISILRIKPFNARQIPTDIWGKLKTTISFVSIVWVTLQKGLESGNALKSIDAYMNLSAILSLAPWVMLTTVILTLLSGINYFWKYLNPLTHASKTKLS